LFPSGFGFRGKWRAYQERVLFGLPAHLEDRRLHVVAAPGSGKTVLGLEVIRRLDRPALVVSPTIAIREQWLGRLVEHFLAEAHEPDWVSRDPRTPGLVTVCTYQALHAALAGAPPIDDGDDEDEELDAYEGAPLPPPPAPEAGRRTELLRALQDRRVGTLVLDEAHHLRREWWKALDELREALPDVTIVSLTATPPYDVPPAEWERYHELCGPVDVEISAPELVRAGDLCPHQDYVYLNLPSPEENERISAFRSRIEEIVRGLDALPEFTASLSDHACVKQPEEHPEEILEDPEFFSSVAVFLHHQGVEAPSLTRVLGHQRGSVPAWDLEWAETLLTGILFRHSPAFDAEARMLSALRRDLSEAGGIDHRSVRLDKSARIEKILRKSIRKLDALGDILRVERDSLGADLRMVVLTDYIQRSELPADPADGRRPSHIGVVPIFETIRRLELDGIRLGVLTGSLVIVPASCAPALRKAFGSDEIVLAPLRHDPAFVYLDVGDAERSRIVAAVTRLLEEGSLTVLVGSKSLLGEGWDAPAINTLVLASFVASYMLSNQMRGRAIRRLPGNPDKTANVWHLVCVEPGADDGGEDYETLARRFIAFVGVSADRPVITNGITRLGLGPPPFGGIVGRPVDEINKQTLSRARDRSALRREWEAAIGYGGKGRLVQQIRAPRARLPRRWLFQGTITALMSEGLAIITFILMRGPQLLQNAPNRTLDQVLFKVVFLIGAAAVLGLPLCLRALWLTLRHGRIEWSMREVGTAVLDSVCLCSVIRTPREQLFLTSEADEEGTVACYIEGATSMETSAFIEAMRQLLSPIENPRYLLERFTPGSLWQKHDYHAVPDALCARKESAETFADQWRAHVGRATLWFTRTVEGRLLLLRARNRSTSGALGPRPERTARWK
jgi:superfamily II DNA or RNA helicase